MLFIVILFRVSNARNILSQLIAFTNSDNNNIILSFKLLFAITKSVYMVRKSMEYLIPIFILLHKPNKYFTQTIMVNVSIHLLKLSAWNAFLKS